MMHRCWRRLKHWLHLREQQKMHREQEHQRFRKKALISTHRVATSYKRAYTPSAVATVDAASVIWPLSRILCIKVTHSLEELREIGSDDPTAADSLPSIEVSTVNAGIKSLVLSISTNSVFKSCTALSSIVPEPT